MKFIKQIVITLFVMSLFSAINTHSISSRITALGLRVIAESERIGEMADVIWAFAEVGDVINPVLRFNRLLLLVSFAALLVIILLECRNYYRQKKEEYLEKKKRDITPS